MESCEAKDITGLLGTTQSALERFTMGHDGTSTGEESIHHPEATDPDPESREVHESPLLKSLMVTPPLAFKALTPILA